MPLLHLPPEDLLSEAVHSAYLQRLVQPNDYVVRAAHVCYKCPRLRHAVMAAPCHAMPSILCIMPCHAMLCHGLP